MCTVNKVSFVSFLSNFSTVFHLFCFYTFYCLFGVSGVNSSLCGVGSILTPVSWGVSEICSFFRGTTALVSCVINCARWWSTGPVRILATWRTCSFSGLAFLLEANPLFLWLCWSFTGSGTVSLDTRVASTGGGWHQNLIRMMSQLFDWCWILTVIIYVNNFIFWYPLGSQRGL